MIADAGSVEVVSCPVAAAGGRGRSSLVDLFPLPRLVRRPPIIEAGLAGAISEVAWASAETILVVTGPDVCDGLGGRWMMVVRTTVPALLLRTSRRYCGQSVWLAG